MTITLIVGKPKKGKTLLMRALMLYSNYDKTFCNIKINGMKYIKVDKAADILNMTVDESSKGLFLDEINRLLGDSWNYNDLAELMSNIATQHRKFRADIIGTIQHMNMVINRVRENCDKIYSPLDIYFNKLGKPAIMRVANIGFNDFDQPVYMNPFYFPLFREIGDKIVYACDLYDTYEFVESFEDVNLTIKEDMAVKYDYFNLIKVAKDGSLKSDSEKMRDLKTLLEDKEHLSVKLCRSIANKIAYNQKLNLGGIDLP